MSRRRRHFRLDKWQERPQAYRNTIYGTFVVCLSFNFRPIGRNIFPKRLRTFRTVAGKHLKRNEKDSGEGRGLSYRTIVRVLWTHDHVLRGRIVQTTDVWFTLDFNLDFNLEKKTINFVALQNNPHLAVRL